MGVWRNGSRTGLKIRWPARSWGFESLYPYQVRKSVCVKDKAFNIKKLLLEGKTQKEICFELSVAKSTVSYHAKNLKLGKRSFSRKLIDWQKVQSFHDAGNSMKEILDYFKISNSTFYSGIKRNKLVYNKLYKYIRPRKLKNSIVFSDVTKVTNSTLKRRIKKDKILKYYCSNIECFLFEKENPVWNNKKLILHLDHVSGENSDNRIENLRWLCPNCHSQTDTYCGRNIKKKNASMA